MANTHPIVNLLNIIDTDHFRQKIENAVKGLYGVDKDSVKVMFNASKIKTQFDSEKVTLETINQIIEALGYGVIKSKAKAI